MTEPQLSPYLTEFEDIPGTYVFNTFRSRQGFHLNQFCMSLMKADNRAAFKADNAAYLAAWDLTDAQRDAVLARDWTGMMREGGNIYFLSKLFSTDGHSFQHVAAIMTGATQAQYAQMMLAGGRDPQGCRSKADPSL
ncbi:MAG: protocatechuate 4,5-dioxygenase subunit alpha [Proteobacteria bacterium]|nr:protocatechuate 4,5-dioxygenase subunit alpha [Pseudomonadota bacterium]